MAQTVINVNYTMRANENNVTVRAGADKSYQEVGVINDFNEYQITKISGKWCYIPNKRGWVLYSKMKLIKDNNDTISVKNINDVTAGKGKGSMNDQFVSIYMGYINDIESNLSKDFMTHNMNNVLGMPYQFPAHVDRKLGGDSVFGRKYAERIVTNMPLLLLTPGKCKFMSEVNQNQRKGILSKLIGEGMQNDELAWGDGSLQDYLNKPTKYYTFEFDPEYYEYVNAILNSTATLMGIDDVQVTIGDQVDKELKSFDWSRVNNPLTTSVGQPDMSYICLYVDSVNTKTENFSNDTMDSQLASKVNSFSDTAKEIQFLVGEKAGNAVNNITGDVLAQAQSVIDDIVDSTLGGNAIFSDLANQFSNVAMGGKIVFPQIYQDSSYSTSYDVDMKLRCPNPTPLNWYLDIMVPLAYLYALTLPKATKGNNGYKSPFLVRGFYKSVFNVDMGIISDLSVSKGKEGAWTNDGYPTEVDVSFTIKDLYNVLFMSKGTKVGNIGDFVTNDQFMSFLANQVGINVNKTDMERTIQMYGMLAQNAFIQRPNYWRNNIESAFNNKILQVYQGIFKI